jgi:acetoin utilization protein AcuB
MNRVMPSTKDYMTPVPHSIAPDDSVKAARELMRRRGVRHLPVMKNGKLVGLVSERDLLMAAELAEPRKRVEVREVMAADPYAVRAEAPSRRRLGSAVVLDGKRVVGVLTTVDALRALADVLQGRFARTEQELLAVRPPRGRTRRLANPRRQS